MGWCPWADDASRILPTKGVAMAMTKATGPVRAWFDMGTTVESCATCARSCKSGATCHRYVEQSSSDPLLFARMDGDAEAALMASIAEWEQNWADAEHRP